MLCKAPQAKKALEPMDVTVCGILIFSNAEQYAKAEDPMLSTPLSIVTVFNFAQPEKASSGMLVTPPGIVIDWIWVLANARGLIDVTLLGMDIASRLER